MGITPGCVQPTLASVYCISSSHTNSYLPFHICEDYLEMYILFIYRFIPKKRTLKEAEVISDWGMTFKDGSPTYGSTLLPSLCKGLKPTALSASVGSKGGPISPFLDTISFMSFSRHQFILSVLPSFLLL